MRNRNTQLAISLLLALSVAACEEATGNNDTESIIEFPGYKLWDEVKTQGTTEQSFSFAVVQYRYAVNNWTTTRTARPTTAKHCSRLFLAGVDLENEYWLAVVAGNHGGRDCVANRDYCQQHDNGVFYGQMVVDQVELDTLHLRLLDREMPGEFIATCNTQKSGDAKAVHTEVRYNGWE
ncbi:MAG: hypothetical protein NXH87_17960 [Rhodobiaceae bacterium]|nr:hypothetical protein [Rhodobiaceae bacterium]